MPFIIAQVNDIAILILAGDLRDLVTWRKGKCGHGQKKSQSKNRRLNYFHPSNLKPEKANYK
jgi:hypothetical protein